jgi:hypothetical protein
MWDHMIVKFSRFSAESIAQYSNIFQRKKTILKVIPIKEKKTYILQKVKYTLHTYHMLCSIQQGKIKGENHHENTENFYRGSSFLLRSSICHWNYQCS